MNPLLRAGSALFTLCVCIPAAADNRSQALIEHIEHRLASAPEVLSARAQLPYLERRWQHRRAWYVPDSDLAITWSDEETDSAQGSRARNARDLEWSGSVTLPVGSNLSLSWHTERGNNQRSIKGTQLPEKTEHQDTVSVGLVQPLLHRWRPAVNLAGLRRARAELTRQREKITLARTTVFRKTVQQLIDLAFQQQRLALEMTLLRHRRDQRDVAETAFAAGAMTAGIRDQARHQWLRQRSRQRDAGRALQNARAALSEPHNRGTADQPIESPSLAQLMTLLRRVPVTAQPGVDSAKLRMARLQVKADHADVVAARYRHWPQVELFADYEEEWSDPDPDNETFRFGIRFRYTLFPRKAEEQQWLNAAKLAEARQNQQAAERDWHREKQITARNRARSEQRLREIRQHLDWQTTHHQRVRKSYSEGAEPFSAVLHSLSELGDLRREALESERDRLIAVLDWTLHHNAGNLRLLSPGQ